MDEEMSSTEIASFQIIAAVGTARSKYVAAIEAAEEGNFDVAENLLEDGKKDYLQGHDAHAGLLTKLANGELPPTDLLLVHAEDQLMSAENFCILAEHFIKLYKTLAAGSIG